ncbi:flippase [Halorientalis halophila]|uniref:flippase n=1 Tax=Halorientalis halophila TaxID=3108499 RepID=UPI00300A9A85
MTVETDRATPDDGTGLVSRIVTRFKTKFVGQAVATVSSSALMVLLARMLDPSKYGMLSLAVAVFGAVGVFSKLGIAKSGARYIAEYKEREPGQIPHILRVAFGLNLVAVVVVSSVLLVGHGYLASLFDEPGLESLLLFGALFLAFEALTVFSQLVLQGFEEIRLAATIDVVNYGCRLLFAVGLVWFGFGALGALGGYIVGFATASLVGGWFVYARFYRGAETSAVETGLSRRIAEYAVPVTATNTAHSLSKRVDTVLVGYFLTPVAVTFYIVSKQVMTFVETPLTALGFTLSPTFGAQKADDNVGQAARIYEEALTYSLLFYVPAAAGIYLVAEPVIRLLFGAEYLGATPVLKVFTVYIVLRSITKITSNALDYLGRARERAIAKGGTAVLNVGLNVLLIPLLGVVGAAVATIATYTLYTSMNVYIIHQEFDLRVGHLFRQFLLVAAVTAGMAGSILVLTGEIGSWIALALTVLLGVVVWGVLSILAGLIEVSNVRAVL